MVTWIFAISLTIPGFLSGSGQPEVAHAEVEVRDEATCKRVHKAAVQYFETAGPRLNAIVGDCLPKAPRP
jgi:hypothetical protein